MTFLLHALLALLLGSLIGAERQWRHRLAGLKTNALVCVGATLFVGATPFFSGEPGSSRIAAQVVTGIGFLGAGVMFRDGITIKGLNTAATLWCAAAVGVLCGSGAWREASAATAVIVLANIVLHRVAVQMDMSMGLSEASNSRYQLRVRLPLTGLVECRQQLLRQVETLQLRILSLQDSSDAERGELTVVLQAEQANFQVIERLARSLQKLGARCDWSSLSNGETHAH